MNFYLKDYKNLIILYPPGLGGNHLKNILMLNSVFSNSSIYSTIEKFYNTVTVADGTAHYAFDNLKRQSLEPKLDDLKNSTKINLLCGHVGEYIWVFDLMEQLPSKLFLTIDFSDIEKTSTQFKRLSILNTAISNDYFLYEQITMYRLDILSRILKSDEKDHSEVSSKLLFTWEIDELLTFLNTEFGLVYTDEQISIIKKIHHIWTKKNLI